MDIRTSGLFRTLCAWLALCAGLTMALPAQADTYTQTRHPIVLVHGLFGFDSLGPIDYWYGIGSGLRSGGATVYVPQQSAANASEVRGEQLLYELRKLKAAYGHTKFNLIGHSHGGQTVRYVAAVAPDLVASVTTVGTPHMGSPVADGVQRDLAATGLTGVVASIANAFAAFESFLSGQPRLPQDSLAALMSLNTAGAASFNSRFPAGKPTTSCGQGASSVNGVRYYSLSGTSVLTNVLDPSDALLGFTSLYFPWGQANDGLVGRCSSHWGVVLRDDYGWNHLDEVNQALGLRGLFASNPVSVLRAHANRLRSLGL
jgi:triacylglycerol lipase